MRVRGRNVSSPPAPIPCRQCTLWSTSDRSSPYVKYDSCPSRQSGKTRGLVYGGGGWMEGQNDGRACVPRPRRGYIPQYSSLGFSHLRVPEVGGDVVAQLPELERDYLADHCGIRSLCSISRPRLWVSLRAVGAQVCSHIGSITSVARCIRHSHCESYTLLANVMVKTSDLIHSMSQC